MQVQSFKKETRVRIPKIIDEELRNIGVQRVEPGKEESPTFYLSFASSVFEDGPLGTKVAAWVPEVARRIAVWNEKSLSIRLEIRSDPEEPVICTEEGPKDGDTIARLKQLSLREIIGKKLPRAKIEHVRDPSSLTHILVSSYPITESDLDVMSHIDIIRNIDFMEDSLHRDYAIRIAMVAGHRLPLRKLRKILGA